MREKECQAPIHEPNCPCQTCLKINCDNCHKTNLDHFTPKCIAKVWGWNKKQTNSPENLQWLSLECHREKDATTPKRKSLLHQQLRGKFVGIEDYRKLLG